MNSINDKVFASIFWLATSEDDAGKTYTYRATAKIHSLSGQAPYFSLTGETRVNGREDSCGMLHEMIAERFPHLCKFLPWHCTSAEEPMHYIANSVYHAGQGNIEGFKHCAVWGVLAEDGNAQAFVELHGAHLGTALANRLPRLMAEYRDAMRELFGPEVQGIEGRAR